MTKYQLMVLAAKLPDAADITGLSDFAETRTAEVQMRFQGFCLLRRYSYDAPELPPDENKEEL
jgi:hypothetical protein